MSNHFFTLTNRSQQNEITNDTTDERTMDVQKTMWQFFCTQSTTAVNANDKHDWTSPYAEFADFKTIANDERFANEELLSMTFMDASGKVIRADIYPRFESVFIGTVGQYNPRTGRAHMRLIGHSSLLAFVAYLASLPNLYKLVDNGSQD